MHTIMVVAGGFALLGVCLLIGWMTVGRHTSGLASGAKWFIPLWLAGAALNMAIGVMQAGYTVAQEFPIFLLVFAIPTVAATLIWRATARR